MEMHWLERLHSGFETLLCLSWMMPPSYRPKVSSAQCYEKEDEEYHFLSEKKKSASMVKL